jgi:hypothetical protein
MAVSGNDYRVSLRSLFTGYFLKSESFEVFLRKQFGIS